MYNSSADGMRKVTEEGKMNFKAAVVEDDPDVRGMLAGLVEEYARERGHGAVVMRYADGYAFMGDYKGDFDVLLLDIDMPGINGMEVAEKVRAAQDAGALYILALLTDTRLCAPRRAISTSF